MKFEITVIDDDNRTVQVFTFTGAKPREGTLERGIPVDNGHGMLTGFRFIPAVEPRVFDDQDTPIARAAKKGFEGK